MKNEPIVTDNLGLLLPILPPQAQGTALIALLLQFCSHCNLAVVQVEHGLHQAARYGRPGSVPPIIPRNSAGHATALFASEHRRRPLHIGPRAAERGDYP
jgi:uncharacterized protein YwlG (UPF0340 family)